MKKTHGLSKTRFYGLWNDMMMRCYNPKTKSFHNYGGRGIVVCKRWHIFQKFYDDMFAGYKKGLSLERKNVNGNYTIKNCGWIPLKDQKYNKQKPIKWLNVNGEKILVMDAAKKYSVSFRVIYRRIELAWSDYECVFGQEFRYLRIDGNLTLVKDVAKKIGLSKSALFYRIANGHPLDKCVLPKNKFAEYLKSNRIIP